MRMRHHFQPMLESMPTRIAPSAVGGLIAPLMLAAAVTHLQSSRPGCQPCDTEMPETGSSKPINPPN